MEKNSFDNNSPIGFFDSGVGGLSVYSRFRRALPNENTIYYGDLKNLPYGNKTQEELIGFARNILDFFETKGVKAVVIACNTSSALAYESVKDSYSFKIYPIIQSCAKVISAMDIKKIGVFATLGTVKSGAYSKELCKYNSELMVREIACPNWVPIVEGVDNIKADEDIKLHLQEMMEFNPDKIILGCTHYPYLMKRLCKYASKDLFIDPAEIFVDYLKQDIELNEMNEHGSEAFYVSAEPESFFNNSKLFYDLKTIPTVVCDEFVKC
ncbi:MAG: glutamate racemase [Bacteroides sp.]|nr:glutamate racemase [Bacteroides sp.]